MRTIGTVSGRRSRRGEGGLLGLAVSPSFADSHQVFVYFTAADDNRLALLTLNADATAIVGEQVLLTGVPKASVHNGGRLAIRSGRPPLHRHG